MDLDLLSGAALTGPALLGALALLALVDSTSFGTLLIPTWLLLAPGRLRPGRILIYLATVAGFYLVVGILLLTVAATAMPQLMTLAATPGFLWAQLIVGAALLIGSFFIGGNRKRSGPGRFARWRERAVTDVTDVADERGTLLPLMGLAVAAAAVEVASMLPYLVGIGLLSTSEFDAVTRFLVLAGYCIVMVLPALALLGLRLVATRAMERPLARLGAWMEKNAAETTGWIVGIIGFLLARAAAVELGLFQAIL
ncbi:GAP family protein [Agromyces cerinus]|uniref:Sap, sulfolipid-1-addressing protein n=1 Tax=Agromyces cerinus subsp. cerinus TaxID=232089 RepID=A0A1N6G748_9MICO|nr:GAP family protein [Agromyces cerinus]SIO03314.1 Sap, sulfolipid-1-addressing protein [Agromyces cerinus subsp. cerinus]